MITLPMGRNGKDSGVPFGSAQETAHDCALWRKCIDGKPFDRLRVRAVNDGYILEERGKALAKRGNRIAEKWWGSTGSPTENLYLDNCLKKRLQRQWYGMLKENALLGNFQHAPQTHYKPLPMKLKCFWCVLRILEWMKQFSSACNTAVRGTGSWPMTKKSFSFSKDFFGSGLLEVLEKEKTCAPFSALRLRSG